MVQLACSSLICSYSLQEMMTQIEGPIVQAFYDCALISWNEKLTPPLPLLGKEPAPAEDYLFGKDHAHIASLDLDASAESAVKTLADHKVTPQRTAGQTAESIGPEESKEDDKDFAGSNQSRLARISKRLNTNLQSTKGTLPETVEVADFRPHILHAPHKPFPIALVNRKPRGSLDFKDINNPQDVAWLAAVHFAQKEIFIQTPTFTVRSSESVCRSSTLGRPLQWFKPVLVLLDAASKSSFTLIWASTTRAKHFQSKVARTNTFSRTCSRSWKISTSRICSSIGTLALTLQGQSMLPSRSGFVM
jgi:hypothetical protein